MTELERPQPAQTDPNTLGLGFALPPVTAENLEHSEVLLDTVLADQETATRLWSINGDVLGVIELPTMASTENKPTEAGQRIAIVDYGPDYKLASLDPKYPVRGKPLSRFGLQGIDYSSEDHGIAVAYLYDEYPEVVLGRDGGGASHDLALDEEQVITENVVSSSHVTINLTPEGILVSDHSKNGTKIYRNTEPLSATEAEPVGVETMPRSKILGSLAVKTGLITEVPWKTDSQSPEAGYSSAAPVAEKVTAREIYETRLENMLKPMSEKDKQQLKLHAMYLANKADAQKDGDGQASTNFGQYAGQAYKAMSPAAKAIATNYASDQSRLWNLN
ncbi:MAG: FHA domain-containing protein [Candidatus Saccharimonadales bacterium]